MPQSRLAADRLERLNRDLHSLRFRCVEPALSAEEAGRRIAEGGRIAAAIRAGLPPRS